MSELSDSTGGDASDGLVPAAQDPSAGASHERDRRYAVFAVTALGAFIASLDLSIVNIAFPAIQRSFAQDPRTSLAWVVTGYSIVFGSLLVTAGRSADRLGARKVFFTGLVVFSLGSALCGLAPSVSLLVAGRLIQGCGAACLLPASLSLLLSAFPSDRRSQVVAFWGGVSALAVATGPSLGAFVVSTAGWRWAFYMNIPVAAAALLVGRSVLPRSTAKQLRAAPDYPGVLLASTSLAALVLGISEGPSWDWSSARIIGCFVGAVILGGAFLRRSAHHSEPVLDLSLFSARSFSVANAATLLYAMGFFAMLLGNILFLTGVWHYSVLKAGLAITPGPLVVAIVAAPAGRLAAKVGFRNVLLVGASLFAAGLCWYATRVGIQPDYVARWLPATLLTGVGIGLTFPVLSAAAVSSLHHEHFAVGSAVNQTARQVGGAVGVALLVIILGTSQTEAGAFVHFRHLWWYEATMVALSGIVCSLLRPRLATVPRPATPARVRLAGEPAAAVALASEPSFRDAPTSAASTSPGVGVASACPNLKEI